MNKNQLFTQLNSLCRELDNSYDINCGGCCLIAAIIAEQLEKFHIPFTLIHYNCGSCHYAIRVKDRIINRSDYRFYEIGSEKEISSNKIYKIYNDTHDWNPMYSRKWNLIVKTKIESLFNKYGNKRT